MRFDRLSYKVVVAYEISRRYFALVIGSGKAEKETKRYDWAPKRKGLLPGTNKKVATARRKNNQNAKEHVLIVKKNEKKTLENRRKQNMQEGGTPPPKNAHTRTLETEQRRESTTNKSTCVCVLHTKPFGAPKGFPYTNSK